ncbi:MAG TPA: hypothetical protein VFE62_00165 [Gemmataceae bacterium]|nr:hypothetical protein [Gemmataceae bacterium]
MRRFLPLLIVLLAFTAIGCPPAPPPERTAKDKTEDKKDPVVVPDDLKTRVEAAIQQVQDRDLLTSNAFWTVFHGILGIGPEKTMLTDAMTKKKVNAVDYICNGGAIRGMQFLPTNDGLDVQTGPQFVGQGHQDQFIAEMAEWGMPADRKFKVGGRDYTFADFTRHSKMRASVKREQELSWAIIIIGQYYGTKARWTNSFGEDLDYDDVVRYETNASVNQAACGGTHRLYGLTWAYHLHLKNGGKAEGVWQDVASKIAQYKELARDLQGPDGACSTDYFKGKGRNPDLGQRISTTGHTVEWLALAMTDAELREPWMQNAVSALAVMILDARDTEVEGGALYHAAHGLYTYHARVYGQPPAYLPLLPKK